MLLSFQDRIRIPCRNGSKQITLDAFIPFILVPIMLIVASINIYTALGMCLIMPLVLGYAYYYLKKIVLRTKFFLSWTIWSIVYLWILFEATVPLLEIVPEENLILFIFLTGSLYCLYKAKQRSSLNQVVQHLDDESTILPKRTDEQTALIINDGGGDDDDDDVDSEESVINQPNVCPKCRKYIPARSFHCRICQTCIVKRDHHNIWLDCCIGELNHRYFFIGLLLGFITLVFGSNLSLTSICHPFLATNIFGIYIFLPDNCDDVFDQFDIALCFIGSIYALVMAVCILLMLIQQIFFISKGVTGTEWRYGDTQHRRSCFSNWKAYICCYR